jgi:hypothetical protein
MTAITKDLLTIWDFADKYKFIKYNTLRKWCERRKTNGMEIGGVVIRIGGKTTPLLINEQRMLYWLENRANIKPPEPEGRQMTLGDIVQKYVGDKK